MTDLEALSELLSGDLPRDRAQALRARIAREPELARSWDELQAMTRELGELPSQEAPPAGLDRAVLAASVAALDTAGPTPAAKTVPSSGRVRWGWVGLAAGVCLALGIAGGLALPSSPTSEPAVLVLADGRHRVIGPGVEVLAEAARVEVRGDAWITVEPGAGPVRSSGQEEAMDVSHALSAAGGAVVTVAVVTGVALVWPAEPGDGPPIEVQAGETRQVGAAPPAPPALPQAPLQVRPDAARADRLDPEVAAWVSSLEQDNHRLRFENQLLQGQLAVINGEPVPWPDHGVPAALQPDAFAQHVMDAVDSVQGLDFVQQDCQEYPCLAVVRVTDASAEDAARDALRQLGQALGQVVDGDANTFMSVARSEEDGQAPRMTAIVGITPGREGEPDPALNERLVQRARALEGDLGEGGADGAGGIDVEDVEIGP